MWSARPIKSPDFDNNVKFVGLTIINTPAGTGHSACDRFSLKTWITEFHQPRNKKWQMAATWVVDVVHNSIIIRLFHETWRFPVLSCYVVFVILLYMQTGLSLDTVQSYWFSCVTRLRTFEKALFTAGTRFRVCALICWLFFSCTAHFKPFKITCIVHKTGGLSDYETTGVLALSHWKKRRIHTIEKI